MGVLLSTWIFPCKYYANSCIIALVRKTMSECWRRVLVHFGRGKEKKSEGNRDLFLVCCSMNSTWRVRERFDDDASEHIATFLPDPHWITIDGFRSIMHFYRRGKPVPRFCAPNLCKWNKIMCFRSDATLHSNTCPHCHDDRRCLLFCPPSKNEHYIQSRIQNKEFEQQQQQQ